MTNSTTARDDGGADDRRDPTRVGPYAEAARAYRAAGWRGVLPVAGKHGNLPGGLTGHDGGWPSDDQVATWVRNRGADNVALRLPDDVLGIDVDAYDGRNGLATLSWFEQTFGELPATWRSSARADGSGIRYFRVPAGRSWVSDLGRGSNVEVIRFAHRFAVVPPSVHPGTRTVYRWRDPTGTATDRPPTPGDLPELPAPWVDALQRGSTTAFRSGDRGDAGTHAGEDAEAVDADGERVDPDLVLLTGLPVGEQQNGLFRYACSLRERRLRRSEMLVLLMAAIQVLDNAPDRELWTPQHVTDLVDRVRRTYPPGAALTPELRELTARLAGAARPSVQVQEGPPRAPLATDLGNSLRFAALHADRVRYAADLRRWYVWDGRRWAADPDGGVVLNLTKQVVDAVRAEALALAGDDRRDLLRWATTSEGLPRRQACVTGAQAEPALRTTSDAFDRDPDLLVVRNGTVDLRTGALRPSEPADLCSRLAEVQFQPEATAPRWEAHVDLMCAGDPTLVAYLRRAVGYTLTGSVGARAFFFLEGTGTNGKNAFVEPVMQLMGSYAQTASPSLLTGGDDQHPTVLADLLGTRLVFVDETRRGRPLNVERVKALTGSKRVKARFMSKDFFEFDARFTLWIAGNGTPKMQDDSDGVWKRLHRVRCLGKIQPDRVVLHYGDLLYAEEASGILNWALGGLRDWRVQGLNQPGAVVDAVEEYRHDENYERQFVEDSITLTGRATDVLVSDDVWLHYAAWCATHGIKGADVKNVVHLMRAIFALELAGTSRFEGKVDGRKRRGISGLRWVNQGG